MKFVRARGNNEEGTRAAFGVRRQWDRHIQTAEWKNKCFVPSGLLMLEPV